MQLTLESSTTSTLCSTVPQITQISPDASTTGSTTITISGSQFGPSAGAASASYVSYTGQVVSLFGDPQSSGFKPQLACGQLVVDSSSVMRCTPPALSGGAASFAVRYKVCVTVPAVSITTCLTSKENTPGQFNFRYTAPSVVAISPGGSSSPISTAGGGSHFLFCCVSPFGRTLACVLMRFVVICLLAIFSASITLSGSQFVGGSVVGVLVNGLASTLTQSSGSSIIFTAPAVCVCI